MRYRLEEYDSIVHDVALASLVTLPLILLIPALALRSLWQPIVVLVPVGIGMAWTYASAALVLGSLNLVTSFLFLIIFGMGDDYPIHLLHRIREELGQGSGLREATGRALRTTAPPLSHQTQVTNCQPLRCAVFCVGSSCRAEIGEACIPSG